jgi:hypothetical protein
MPVFSRSSLSEFGILPAAIRSSSDSRSICFPEAFLAITWNLLELLLLLFSFETNVVS